MAKKARKPTQIFVEVESDEEAQTGPPRLRGALRGLNPNNMLSASKRLTDADKESDRNASKSTPRHETRASRNGKAQVNYSAKYHPMDEVTRPKRARRVTGSPSVATSSVAGCDDETSGESEPAMPSGSGSEADGDDADDAGEDADILPARVPDPGATRHSSRSEARKSVNYSRAHHPQDHSLPGYRHLAKRRKRALPAAKPQKKRKSQPDQEEVAVSSDQAVINDSGEEDDDENDENDEEQSAPQSRTAVVSSPRKKLKSLGRDKPHNSNARAQKSVRPKPSLPQEESLNPVEAIIQGQHFAPHEHDTEASQRTSNSDPFAGQSTKQICDLTTGLMEELMGTDGADSGGESPAITVGATIEVRTDGFSAPEAESVNGNLPLPQNASVEGNTTAVQPSTGPLKIHLQNAQMTPPPTLKDRQPPLSLKRLDLEFVSSGTTDQSDDSSSTLDSEQDLPLTQRPDCEARDRSGISEDVEPKKLIECSMKAKDVSPAKHTANKEAPSPLKDASRPKSTACQKNDSNPPRQISRDTLPDDDDPSSVSHFEEAMAGVQSNSQRVSQEDILRSAAAARYSDLPISQRGRSDDHDSEKDEEEVRDQGGKETVAPYGYSDESLLTLNSCD